MYGKSSNYDAKADILRGRGVNVTSEISATLLAACKWVVVETRLYLLRVELRSLISIGKNRLTLECNSRAGDEWRCAVPLGRVTATAEL